MKYFNLPALLSWLTVFSLPAASAEAHFRIGVILPLSGPTAAWGNDVRKVLLFAQREFKSADIHFVFEDDQCTGKNAVSAASKLINVDKVNAAMVVCSESMLTTAPLFEQAHVVVVTPVATAMAVSQAGKYIFRTWPSDEHAAAMLANTICPENRRVGLLTEERGFSMEFSRAISQKLVERGERLVEETFSTEHRDVRSLITRLKSSNVNALIISANSDSSCAAIVAQIEAMKWDVRLYGAYLPGGKEFLALAGNKSDGLVFVDAPSNDANLTEEGRRLLRKYLAANGALASADFVFVSTFEALRVLASSADSQLPSLELLGGTTFHGIAGDYRFDENGDIEGPRHELRIIEHGSPKPYSGGCK
jgi:branched-chain amino acid transport system substrate-binding protein